jgi:ferredoxin
MPHQVTIQDSGEVFHCAEDMNVLAAMEQARCHGIPVGCRNGGCGACKVCVTTGRFKTRKMNRAVVSLKDESEQCVLACKTYPLGDIVVRVLSTSRRAGVPANNAGFNFIFNAPHQKNESEMQSNFQPKTQTTKET